MCLYGARADLIFTAQVTPMTAFLKDVHRVALQARESGGQPLGPASTTWHVAGGCLNPQRVEYGARPSRTQREARIIVRPGVTPSPHWVEMWTRCRKCIICRKWRSARWQERAKFELLTSARTWFGTLTLSPDAHVRAHYRADLDAKARGVTWAEITGQEQFFARHKAIGPELARWLKRVRKESGAPLRYLLVAEAHKSGLPHYHCLIHEVDEAQPVRYSCLTGQWHLGFTKFNLVKDVAATNYVTKYLTKSADARVRASLRYGYPPGRDGLNP